MSLPETIRVKLSSEGAESISITPVVAREMPVRELVAELIAVMGKDAARIGEALGRGAIVIGSTRFRWSGWDADAAALAALVATFPDADPARAFDPERCVRAALIGAGKRLELPRAALLRRRLLRRRHFWQVLLQVAAETAPAYVDYSYRERGDRYRAALTPDALARLRRESGLIVYPSLIERLRAAAWGEIEFLVERLER